MINLASVFAEEDASVRPFTLFFAVLISAFSITTGVMIVRKKPSAFAWLKWYFGVYLGLLLLALGAEMSQSKVSPDTTRDLIRGAVYVAIWTSYFKKSKRVLVTFGRNM